MPTHIYLDHAATTPVRPEVREAMLACLTEEGFGNPSSAHALGRAARAAVERARQQVAAAMGASAREIVFTSGGTEADNLAILGFVFARLVARDGGSSAVHLVSSPTEHKAVLGALHEAERLGARVTMLPVDADGVLSLDALDDVLSGRGPGGRPSLVSVMWVNNEVGTVQPVPAIAERCAQAGVPFHTDAVQAFGKLPVDLGAVPCTACTISAHKIGGPKGVGALIVREPGALRALIHGGAQQGGLRPGTENVAGIVGLGVAAELAVRERAETTARLAAMRLLLEEAIRERMPEAIVHGAGAERAPNIVNVSVPGTDSEAMLMHLDLAGIACASGSACTTGSVEPSHVLVAMGVPRDVALGAVRFSLGALSTPDQMSRAAEALAKVAAKVRSLQEVLGRA